MSRPNNEQIERWYPRLFRAALRMTGNEDEAADLTQQTFCKALSNWGSFNNCSLATTWLHRILVNNLRDNARRKSTRREQQLDEWALHLVGANHRHALDRMDKNEQLARLRDVIESLSATLRQAFIVTVIDGYTYQEASELLGAPVGTIASRVSAARAQVSEVMRREFPE